ncbi:MAG: ribbon-helix-helix domain-containing protein [Ignisphaera sp.]
MNSDEFRKEFEKLLDELRESVKKLTLEVERLLDAGNVREAYRVWRERSRTITKEFNEYIEKLKSMDGGIDEKSMEEVVKEVRERVEEVVEEISKSFNYILKRFGESSTNRTVSPPIYRAPKIFIGTVEDVFNSIMHIFKGIEEAIEESLKSVRDRLDSVVSARIRKRELDVIDQLVDAGIFRSRSEAIAYFVRRGIESSREWIEKALEKAKKIRELQESIRRELNDLDKNNE